MTLSELIFSWLTERGYEGYIYKTRNKDCYYIAPKRGRVDHFVPGRFIKFSEDSVKLYRNPPPEEMEVIIFWAGDTKLFESMDKYFPPC